MVHDLDLRQNDPVGLGRGRITRRLPVLGQASREAPTPQPITFGENATPTRFAVRIALSAPKFTVPAAAMAIIHQIGKAIVPVLMGLAIDRALDTADTRQLIAWLLILGVNFLVLSIAFRFSTQLGAQAEELVAHRLRSTLSGRVLHPATGRVGQSSGTILSTSTNDVTRVSSGVRMGIYPVGELAGIGFITVSLFVIHVPLGLAAAIGAPVVVWAMDAIRGPYTRRTRRYQALLASAVGQATDLVTGYRIIKGIGAEDEAQRRYRRASREALGGAKHSITSLGMYLAGSTAISGLFVAGVAALAGYYAVDNAISIGELIAAVGLTQALLSPLIAMTTNAGALWAGAVASAGRVVELLVDADQSTPPQPAPDTGRGPEVAPAADVVLSANPVIDIRINGVERIRLGPGEIVGLHTDDRTATDIVAALLQRPAGDSEIDVRIDGVDSRCIDRTTYSSRVTVAPHTATLFSGTIADNLDLVAASQDARDSAIHAAACVEFVGDRLSEMDSQVGENGNQLSGGQRQRLALARALATEAPILVLDDPTTAIDSVTEAAIAERLAPLRHGLSTLVIASAPALLDICDRVVRVERDEAPRKGIVVTQ